MAQIDPEVPVLGELVRRTVGGENVGQLRGEGLGRLAERRAVDEPGTNERNCRSEDQVGTVFELFSCEICQVEPIEVVRSIS